MEDANRQVDDEGQQPVLGRHPGREPRSPQTHAQQPAENRSFFIQPAKDITFHGIYFQTNVIIISPVPGRSPFSIKQIQARPWGRTGRAPLASEVLSTRATGIRSSLLILKIKYFNQPNEIK